MQDFCKKYKNNRLSAAKKEIYLHLGMGFSVRRRGEAVCFEKDAGCMFFNGRTSGWR